MEKDNIVEIAKEIIEKSQKDKKICNVGDKFYRVFKGQLVETEITSIEKMPLGHYVYKDNLNYNSTAFSENILTRYYIDKEIGQEILELQAERENLKEQIEEINAKISELKELNKKQILDRNGV